MIFTDTKIKGHKREFKPLEKVMKSLGFVRWAWDLHKVTYDKKYTLDEAEYYLRVHGKVINEKVLEHPKALVQLQPPVFARHFFPHGLDNDVEVPTELSEQIDDTIAEIQETLATTK